MSLAPYATGRNEEDGSGACAKQEVAGELGDVCQGAGEELGYGDCVGGEDGAKGCGEDAGEAESEGDEIAAPEGPVEGVVGVVGWLRDLSTRLTGKTASGCFC